MNGLNLSPWTEEDLKKYQELEECLSKHASWSGTTAEMVKLHRSLVWYAQVHAKIKASLVSDIRISQPAQAPEEQAKEKKSKAKEVK